MKRLPAILMIAALAFGTCACSGTEEQGPDYADDEAMEIIADGLEERSDLVNEQTVEGTTGETRSYKEAVQAELELVNPLKDRQFENSELQEKVLSYINVLNDSLDVLETYPTSDVQFYNKWTEVYDERTSIINDFVENYGLELDDDYQYVLDELAANGAAATKRSEVESALNGLVEGMVFEQIDEGYGNYTYTATAQNTTGINFGNVSLVVALYDEAGVKAEETYVSTNSWPAGETVRFEAWSDMAAAQVKATVDYYEVSE